MGSSSVDPKEMRGVGITISKLEQLDSGKSVMNNSILKFVQKEFKATVPEKENKPPKTTTSNQDEEIDPEFLASLPPDIRAEVEAQVRNRKQVISGNKLKTKVKSRNPFLVQKNCTVEQNNSKAPSLDPEILDPEVLNQLPPEIRAEVEDRFKNGETSPSVQMHVKEIETDTSNLQPGPRNTNAENHQSTMDHNSLAMSSTLSELDPTFLDQLPPDIRAEIEAEYRNQG